MGKTLRADIIVGGKADSSFYRLGSELETLGSQVNLISEKLIQFGKESVDAYASYEDYMLDAEVALRTQYNSTNELSKVMEQLDQAAMQWASDSRFTTEDVAGAISNAAHAGWDLEKILTGVPSAMKISLAGGMELAEGLEYLVDISNAAGVGFDELGTLVDYWAYAANRSSTTIPEMGAAMQKMGATMQFVKGDMAGLTTMLGVLANNGAKGTEAGTLLRNSFIRMIAPTKKAAEEMDQLILSGEDLDDIYSNTAGLEEAAALLEEAGFSAYDSQGRLKSFMTIWQELDKATSGMTEQDRNNVLSAIFPTRTITGALALLEAASNDWDGLYASILNNADGYADYASETMESGLGGTLRHLESVYNTLQTRTGNSLAEDVSSVASALSGMIDSVNGLDGATFDAMVAGLEAIAVAGPGLMVAGGAIKIIGAIAGTGLPGQLILASIGLAAFANAMSSVSEAMYADHFGNLNVDMDSLGGYLDAIGGKFNAAQQSISEYNSAVETAISDYESASSKLKESLLTSMLTGAALTESDIEYLHGLGDQMRQALIAGIDGSYSSAEETVALFADGEALRLSEDENGIWASVMDTLSYGYEQAISRAEALSAELRNAMTSAFADGSLTSEELDNFQNIINQQNELLAMQADARNAVEREKMLRQAQTLGLDALEQISTLVETQRGAELSTLEDEYWQAYYQTELGGQLKIKNGVRKADGTLYTQADLDRELEALYSGDPNDPTDGYLGKKMATEASFDRMLLDLYNSTADGSGLGDVWKGLGAMADSFLDAGTLTETAIQNYQNAFEWSDRNDISQYIGDMVNALGGMSEVQARADYYSQIGELTSANAFARLMAMYSLSDAQVSGLVTTEDTGPLYSQSGYDVGKARAQNAALAKQDEMTDLAWSYMADALESGVASNFQNIMSHDFTDTGYQTGIESIVSQMREVYDLAAVPVTKGLESIHDYAAAYRLMFDETVNAQDYKIQVTPEIDETGLETLGNVTIPVDIVPREDGMGLSDLEQQGVTVDVEGDTTTLSATIDAEDGQTLLEYVDGDAENLSLTITDQDGRVLVENVTGNTAALASAINAYNGKVVTVTVNYKSSGFAPTGRLYAEGGRATEPSIFGEVPGVAEWAIPEQHTQRTAELLDAAREASGFTWPDLIGRNGDLSTAAKGSWTLVYSPVIHAANADGVEQKLRDDKNRLEKWLRDKQLHDEMEVYS